jgi:P4 family phage/plasmid primase-like protien
VNVSDWLEALNFTGSEFVAVCHKHMDTGDFKYSVLPPAAVPGYVELMADKHDVWLGVNPVAGPPRSTGGRGKPEDVTRLSAVFCDLDIKPGGCPDIETAQQIVAELADVLGEYPVMVVYSGHGLQPYWAIEDGHGAAESLLLRFGRLVRVVAAARNVKVDSVFDMARILRAPDTYNRKESEAKRVDCVEGNGAPMMVDTLDERLAEAGIFEEPGDTGGDSATVVSDPSEWGYTDKPCGYITAAARQWMTEPVDGRHPWALRCMVRLECARRFGCVSYELYQGISQMIEQRLLNLLASQQPSRKPHRFEWRDIQLFAEQLASTKSAADLMSELGNHDHLLNAPQKPSNVTTLPTSRNAGKSGSAGSSSPGIATVTPLPTAQPQPQQTSMTDVGNADLLVAQYADKLRYLPGDKTWYCWDGTRWRAHDDDSPAVRAARAVADGLPVIPGDKTAMAHKRKSQSQNGILSMIRLARADARMQIDRELLDARPYELNTPEGIVDLRTGALLPHDPARWHTKITGVHYDSTAAAPLWEGFLHTTFQGQTDAIRYVQQLAGYSCIGEITRHILPFLYGEVGQNGKSVLMRVLQDCLGDYATTLPVAVLVSGRNEHTEHIASLHGVRLAVCSEVGVDTKWDEEKIKNLTGGDNISARHLFGKMFSFRPSHTIWVAANDAPRVESGGKSFFRRFKVIPFLHSIPDDQVDERLPFKLLESEGPAILAWMIRGSVDLCTNGMPEPRLVSEATSEYQESEDRVLQWLSACCHRGGDDSEGEMGDRLYQSFRQWSQANRLYPVMNSTAFGRALTKHGVGVKRTNAGRIRTGIKLLHEMEPLPNYVRGPGI